MRHIHLVESISIKKEYFSLRINPKILVAELTNFFQYECVIDRYYLILHPDVYGYLQS